MHTLLAGFPGHMSRSSVHATKCTAILRHDRSCFMGSSTVHDMGFTEHGSTWCRNMMIGNPPMKCELCQVFREEKNYSGFRTPPIELLTSTDATFCSSDYIRTYRHWAFLNNLKTNIRLQLKLRLSGILCLGTTKGGREGVREAWALGRISL